MKLIFVLAVAMLLGACHSITTEPGSETVIVDNPWLIGHGGVRDETQKPGLSWYWLSTKGVDVVMTPTKYDEPLDHLVLNYQDTMIKLNNSIKIIETLYSQLTRRIDETLYRMLEIGNLSHEMRIMETIRARTRNATQNIQVDMLVKFS